MLPCRSADAAAWEAAWGAVPKAAHEGDTYEWDSDPTLEAAREALKDAENGKQASLLRDIFGNPFCTVTLSSAWLAWNVGTVLKLAQGIYDNWALDRLPILADALEDAGCQDAGILAHCRQPGQHVRGCWVLDLVRSAD